MKKQQATTILFLIRNICILQGKGNFFQCCFKSFFLKTHYDVLPVNAVIEFLTFDANNATQKKNIKTGYTKMAGVLHDFESIGLI